MYSIPSAHRLPSFSTIISTARFAIARHGTAVNPSRRGGRFEPVAVVKQLSDGRGTLFALVAARRQKEFKRGIDTYAKHVCRRRRDGSQYFPLFVLFVLFGQAKRTLKPFYDFSQKIPTNKKTRLFRALGKRVIMPAYRVICLN